jgi:hypothetical protein
MNIRFELKKKLNLLKSLDVLLKELNEREQDILRKRYGLRGEKKHTLEQIGKLYKITRERVRQIEKNTIKKLKKLDDKLLKKSRIHEFRDYLTSLLKDNGGAVEEFKLINHLKDIHRKADSDTMERTILFTLDHLVESVDRLAKSDKRLATWKLSAIERDILDGIIEVINEIISEHDEPLSEEKLLSLFVKTEFYRKNEALIIETCDIDGDKMITIGEIFISYLKISKKIKKNIFDKWGLTKWESVQPKKINDKAYLVLKKAEKPLHFTEITDLINKANFDTKTACPATVHNELILNDQYVLVGRGIYALKEWGYKKGTVIDVIENVLSEAGKPMTKDDIVEEVLRRRIVRKSTIYLSLLNKHKFKKVGFNMYDLKG